MTAAAWTDTPTATATATATSTPAPTSTPTITPTSTPTQIGGGGGRLAFLRAYQEGHHQLELIDIEGGNPTVLADLGENNQYIPVYAWSPDGSSLVFDAMLDGAWGIFVLDVSTSDIRRIASTKAFSGGVDWSPDGSLIAFDDFHTGAIYLVRPDGTGLQPIVEGGLLRSWGPVWSPDGSSIAFTRGIFADSEIFVLDLNSREMARLTDNRNQDNDPHWSPDGHFIAYQSDSWTHITDKEGALVTKIPATSWWGWEWMPGGLLVAAQREQQVDKISLFNSNGEVVAPLDMPSSVSAPLRFTVSPDGQWIAFEADVTTGFGVWRVFIMRRDGSQLRELISGEGGNSTCCAKWQP